MLGEHWLILAVSLTPNVSLKEEEMGVCFLCFTDLHLNSYVLMLFYSVLLVCVCPTCCLCMMLSRKLYFLFPLFAHL